MKIIKYKKMSKGRYKITFDTSEVILYEDVIIRNNLLLLKDIDLETLEKVLKENREYEAYDLSLSYIEIKLRTEKEIRDYLEKKGFDSFLVDETINKLRKDNLINEKFYTEAFVNDKVNLTTWGPFKIKRALLDLGISDEIVDDYLYKIDTNIFKDKLDKIVNKKMISMKNKSLYMIKNKLNNDLFDLGYDKDMISEILSKLEKDDSESMKKEASKAYDKYSKKYSGKELEMKIKSHLYAKGFKVDTLDFME